MKALLTASSILLLTICVSAQPCKRKLTATYLDSIDMVATVEYTDFAYNRDFYVLGVNDVFFGDPPYTITLDTAGVHLEDGKEYLVYGLKKDDIQRYAIDTCSRTAPLEEASEDIEFLKATIQCPGKPYYMRTPCEKLALLVCGCDGKTYGNPCEARKAGITRYRFGACRK